MPRRSKDKDIETARILGILAPIISIVGIFVLPFVLGIVAAVLIYLAVSKVGDEKAVSRMKIATVFRVAANSIAIFSIFFIIASIVGVVVSSATAMYDVEKFITTHPEVLSSLMLAFGLLLAAFLCFLLWAIFLYLSYSRLAEIYKNELFKVAGILFIIGVLLLIVAVGVFVVIAGFIVEALAWATARKREI